jgi:hypothetical protein
MESKSHLFIAFLPDESQSFAAGCGNFWYRIEFQYRGRLNKGQPDAVVSRLCAHVPWNWNSKSSVQCGHTGQHSGSDLQYADQLLIKRISSSMRVCVCVSGGCYGGPSATTEVVYTTAITANSQVLLTFDSSLGVRLGVTGNSAAVQGTNSPD